MKQAPVNIKNKRATFDYELVDTYTAGIVLTGTEIMSRMEEMIVNRNRSFSSTSINVEAPSHTTYTI